MENRMRPLSSRADISREVRGWTKDLLVIAALASFIIAVSKAKELTGEVMSAMGKSNKGTVKNEENDGFSDPE